MNNYFFDFFYIYSSFHQSHWNVLWLWILIVEFYRDTQKRGRTDDQSQRNQPSKKVKKNWRDVEDPEDLEWDFGNPIFVVYQGTKVAVSQVEECTPYLKGIKDSLHGNELWRRNFGQFLKDDLGDSIENCTPKMMLFSLTAMAVLGTIKKNRDEINAAKNKLPEKSVPPPPKQQAIPHPPKSDVSSQQRQNNPPPKPQSIGESYFTGDFRVID